MRPTLFLLALLGACGPKPAPAPVEPAPAPQTHAEPARTEDGLHADAVLGVSDPGLRVLLSEHWDATMEHSPTWATRLGDHRFDDRLWDSSPEADAAWTARVDGWIGRARALDATAMSAADQLTLRLFLWELEDGRARDVCRFSDWSVLPRSSALVSVNELPEDLVVQTPEDAANLLARYRAASGLIDQEGANLRRGLADGLVANAHSVGLVIEQLDQQLGTEDAEWPLLEPLTVDRPDWDPGFAAGWQTDLRAVVADEIRPALVRYRDLLRDEVLPEARPADATGLSALPLEGCYPALVESFTTLQTDPDTVHQRGLDALEGIHAEFRALGTELWQTDDLTAIFERLRTDEALFFETEEQVQAKAEQALAKATDAMPQAFGRLPEAACVVEPIPAYQAPYTTIAYYQQPTPGERPGTYFVNTYAPRTRPRHEAEVLAFHEAIPGHHLQIAISQELPDVPAFRRHMGFTAFVEGWALYTERLSDELGLYSGDLDRMGMLSFDAWRATRLVVDTGIHHKGWSREQAVAFFLENTPLAPNNIDNEVDRYITWPGQALAYKTGQLEIKALRTEAEAALGDDFDLSAFHDVVLGAGAVPLPVLRERVGAWTEQARTTPSGP